MNPKLKLRVRNAGMGLLAFVLALAIWLPCLHFFFRKPLEDFYQENGISPKARQLAARHLLLWTDSTLRQAELKKMQKFAVAIPLVRSVDACGGLHSAFPRPPNRAPAFSILWGHGRLLPGGCRHFVSFHKLEGSSVSVLTC
jgi:hypothetical protein